MSQKQPEKIASRGTSKPAQKPVPETPRSRRPKKPKTPENPNEQVGKQDTPKSSRSDKDQAVSEPNQQAKAMSTAKRGIYAKAIEGAHRVATGDQFQSLDMFQIEDRMQMMDNDWDKFRLEHEAIIGSIDDTQAEAQANEYDRVMEMYLATRSTIRARIDALKPKIQAQATIDRPIQVTLKQNEGEIPNTWGTFSGDCLKWPSFRDCFKVIHDNANLTAARKFYFLQEALKGEAAL